MYITNLVVTYSKINFIEYLMSILKKNKLNSNIEYLVNDRNVIKDRETLFLKIESKNNIYEFLKKNFKKINLILYPKEIFFYLKNKNLKKHEYFIKSKINDNNNYFYMFTQYTTKINVDLLI